MKFGYTIIYVPDVSKVLAFYSKAFGFKISYLHETREYGELDTGETKLAFGTHEVGASNITAGYQKCSIKEKPFGMELTFVTEDVEAAFNQAVKYGAKPLSKPKKKGWGQVIAYVRAIEGTVIELCSPVDD